MLLDEDEEVDEAVDEAVDENAIGSPGQEQFVPAWPYCVAPGCVAGAAKRFRAERHAASTGATDKSSRHALEASEREHRALPVLLQGAQSSPRETT